MKTLLILTTTSLLVACGGMTEDKFQTELVSATCDKIFECTTAEEIAALDSMSAWTFGDTPEECSAALNEPVEDQQYDTGYVSDCDFNKDMANACLEEYALLTCDDLITGAPSCEKVCDEE